MAEIPHDLIGSSGLYNHPDPLLRRLRLEEQNGAAVTDLARTFGDVEILVLYAGSAQGSNNLLALHKDLTTLHMREKKAAVIYVSTDVDAKLALGAAGQFPWYRMVFYDDSDFAPLSSYAPPDAVEVSRGEAFVQAGEIEIGAYKVPYSSDEYIRDYVRPLSRAAVAISMKAYSTPSLAVYHIGNHEFVAHNLRPSAFTSKRIGTNVQEWRSGASSASLLALRWPIIILIIGALYHALVYFGGDQYDVITRTLEGFSKSRFGM